MGKAKHELARLAGGSSSVTVALMRVDSVRSDGTVNLIDGSTVLPAIPCDTSYLSRKAGDRVAVLRWDAGWFVLGPAGKEWAPPTDSGVKVSWGDAAPSGAGWVTGTPWVREGELYIQTVDPSPPPSPETLTVTLQPTSQGAWRDGRSDNEQAPTQGAWPSYPHPYTGAWFWSNLAATCAGKSVASMSLRVERTGKDHGSYGGVKPRFYLLAGNAAGSRTPALGDGPVYGPALGLGVEGDFTLPGSWRDALASGAAGGVGVYAEVGSGYLIFTGSCGQLTATFQ